MKTEPADKSGLHPRNKNNTRYDFESLIKSYPELQQFVFTNKYARETINFASHDAVRALNRVLLKHYYGLSFWDIPKDYLCPPVPGRADYIHYIADLLASCNSSIIPRGQSITVFDIGVGANCIYPIIGNKEYGWHIIGSDIDPVAVLSARKNVNLNNFSAGCIDIRHQSNPDSMFDGIIGPNDKLDITMCNPPFHSSIDQAEAGTRRKWKNLDGKKGIHSTLNFGGKHSELLYEGGEESFVQTMIRESGDISKQVFWFTTLISKRSHLPLVYKELKTVNALDVRTIAMAQGQKKSRFVAWTFLDNNERTEWRMKRWNTL